MEIRQYKHPKKTHYWLGENFDFTGLQFFAIKPDGTKEIITATMEMVDSSAFNPQKKGTHPITVTYAGSSYTFNTKVSQKQNFRIDGTKIMDPNGEEFIPIGANVNGPRMWWRRDTLQDVDIIADTWNFNTVRLVTTFNLELNLDCNTDMHAIINAFTDKGVVVMVEMHDYTGGYPKYGEKENSEIDKNSDTLEVFCSKWVELAKQLKDNPYVWINIMNEPSGAQERTWWDGEQEDVDIWYHCHDYITNALRNCGFDNIIVLDENGYGQGRYKTDDPDGTGSAILYNGPKLNNKYKDLLYSLHPYGWAVTERMEKFIVDCHKRGLALVMGEYGPVTGDLATHKSTFNIFHTTLPHKVGRLYWAWDGDFMAVCNAENAVSATGAPGGWGWQADALDGTKPSNLTWWGELVWADAKGTLSLPIPKFDWPLLVNGDFTQGFAGWHNIGNNRLTRIEKGSFDGSDAACLGAGNGYTAQEIYNENLIPGATYAFGLWGKATGVLADNHVKVGFAYTPEGGKEIQEELLFTAAEWKHQECTFTLPDAKIQSARIFVWKTNSEIDFFFDKVMFRLKDA